TPDIRQIEQLQVQGRRYDVRQDGFSDGNLVALLRTYCHRPALTNQNSLDAGVETQLATGFAEPPQQGVCNGLGSTHRNTKTAGGGQQGQHEAQAIAGQVVRPEVNVQCHGRDHTASGLSL